MNWSNKSLSFLALTNEEVKILNSLENTKNHSEISADIKIPRTTVAFLIKKLIKKGLALPIHYGKRFRYISITEEQLTNKLKQTLGEMKTTANERKGAQIRISKESQFTIHVGIKEVIEAYSRIASINKDTRIKAIQGYKSWITIIEKLTPEQLIRFNQLIIENKLIVESILQDRQYEWYGDYLKKHSQISVTKTAQSLTGRMADYTTVSSNFFNEYSEIWIFKTTVIIINWQEEVAIEITNQQIMSFLQDMFELVKISGKKVNHEEEMRRILISTK